MKTCLFAGPTLWQKPTPRATSRYGPVALGSVFRAVEAGYRRIGIVDGYFGNLPAVWHKEILFAMSSGVEVLGAASMGALRAAELSQLGMVGLGRIYRMFRCGAWTDDDEVAVLHAPEELGYEPLSEAMADIRFTLRRMRTNGAIDVAAEKELVRRMKSVHFSGRTRDELRRQSLQAFGTAGGTKAMEAFDLHYVDAKGRDAQTLVARLADPPSDRPLQASANFLSTRHWRTQFVAQVADIPPLR